MQKTVLMQDVSAAMTAVVCVRYGPPEVLELRERAIPEPRPREVRIRVRATAVTSSDCYLRGLRLSPVYRLVARVVVGWNAPRRPVLGMVASGVVDAVGHSVRNFAPGDRVVGLNVRRFGAYAQYVCWPADGLIVGRPEGVDDEAAASVCYGALLAGALLRRADVQAGQRVLVHGASGAVGTAAVQLATGMGGEVTGVCSAGNASLVRSLGAGAVLDYTKEHLDDSGAQFDVVLDAVGRHKSAQALSRSEHILTPGGVRVSVDDGTPKLRREDLTQALLALSEGRFTAVTDRVYPLESIVEAHRYVDQGHKRGNVVLTVP